MGNGAAVMGNIKYGNIGILPCFAVHSAGSGSLARVLLALHSENYYSDAKSTISVMSCEL
jgi:hypothetical protein